MSTPLRAVSGFYETNDIIFLRDALLKERGLVTKTDDQEYSNNGYTTYISSAVSVVSKIKELDGLKDVICIALLSKKDKVQVLAPYRMVEVDHWVTFQILIESNKITLRIHDSAEYYKNDDDKEKKIISELADFLESDREKLKEFVSREGSMIASDKQVELEKIFFDKDGGKTISFKNLGRSNAFKIQKSGVYCGGYTTRLIVNLTENPIAKVESEEIWQCHNKDDKALRAEDAQKVLTYNPEKAAGFGTKTRGNEHQNSPTHKEKEAKQIEDTERVLLEAEKLLDAMDEKLLKEIFEMMSNREGLTDFRNIKMVLIGVYTKHKGSLAKNNPLMCFFEKDTKEIDENARVNTSILAIELWRKIINLMERKIKKESAKNPVVLEVSNEWDIGLYSHFLKLKMISNFKAHKVDCKFEEIDVISLRNLLSGARDELIKIEAEQVSILIVRKLNEEWIIFQISKEKCGEKNKNTRFALALFSAVFVKDSGNNLRCKSWEAALPSVKYSSNIKANDIVKNLVSTDFLRLGKDCGITRLSCYAVLHNIKCSQTILLHKLFTILELEKREIQEKGIINEGRLMVIHQEYMRHAQHAFVKNAGVAKAQQGFRYQENLIMILAYLAKEDLSKKFTLIAEARIPDAWNDVVLEWDEQLVFFQQKHRSSYAFSVKETYTTAELLSKDDDASILKYYLAYCELMENIENSNHPLHCYRDKALTKNLKFIFFSNKKLPLVEASDGVHLEGEKDIKFKMVNYNQTPLIELKGFDGIVGNRRVWQIQSLNASKLKLPQSSKKDLLNKFFESFYFFTSQMDADQLLQHSKKVIQSHQAGFGQAFLADTFSHYVHNWFVTENPDNHVLDRTAIVKFFDNHERYHYNLVKYSCYDYAIKEIRQLISTHIGSLKKLSCLVNIQKTESFSGSYRVLCQNPLIAAALIQELFPVGKRQVFTEFSSEIAHYNITRDIEYVIIVGENNELFENIRKINDGVKIIQIELLDESSKSDLKVIAQELRFLQEEYPFLSILEDGETSCVTDFFLFAITQLKDAFSSEERAKYVEQRLSKEEVVLPFDKIELQIKEQMKANRILGIEDSWFVEQERGLSKCKCKIHITLPEYLDGKSIQPPSNSNFIWNESERTLYYLVDEKEYFAPIELDCPLVTQKNINFSELAKSTERYIAKEKPFDKKPDVPNVMRKLCYSLKDPYNGVLPEDSRFQLSGDRKKLFYSHYGAPKLCTLKFTDISSDKKMFLIEAEAACGKTWHLRDKIKEDVMLKERKISGLIRVKDIGNIKNLDDPISELIDQSTFPEHLRRLAKRQPRYFHLLLDGFDELSKEFTKKFEDILKKISKTDYSVSITVRDYQTDNLLRHLSGIVVRQRLNKFDEPEITKCLLQSLSGKFPIDRDRLVLEIKQLIDVLNKHSEVSEWLGIPLHVALISEWYVANREILSLASEPTISEIYNFILQSRISRGSKRNRGDIYKILFRIAYMQIFGEKEKTTIFSVKTYNLKQDLNSDLERTGLLRYPWAEKPELFHRTFAEFLIAKRVTRKIIKNSCGNNEVNLRTVQILYQTEYRLVCHFFIGLFKDHRLDLDIPYELTKEQQSRFEKIWLLDIAGQGLIERQKDEKQLTWLGPKKRGDKLPIKENSPAVPDASADSAKQFVSEFDKQELQQDLSIGFFQPLRKIIESKELNITDLNKYISTAFSMDYNENLKNVFKVCGLYIQVIKEAKEFVFKSIWGALNVAEGDKCRDLLDETMLDWWDIEDLIIFIIFGKQKSGEKESERYMSMRRALLSIFNKEESSKHKLLVTSSSMIVDHLKVMVPSFQLNKETKVDCRQYLILCFAIYNNSNDNGTLKDLRIWIRWVNFNLFLRNDYPADVSIFEKCKEIDDLNVGAIAEVFTQLKEISKNYDWFRNRGSHAFQCWSHGDKSDLGFAMPVLRVIGGHLNIVHVLYVRCYVSFGGYDESDRKQLMLIAINHISKVKNEKNVNVVFLSVLLFLSLVDDWKLTEEHPCLSSSTLSQIILSFEILLNSSEIDLKNKLFIHIMFVSFMLKFSMRGYLGAVNNELSLLTLLLTDGTSHKLKINCGFFMQTSYVEIREFLLRSPSSENTIEQFQNLFDVWSGLISKPSPGLQSLLSIPDPDVVFFDGSKSTDIQGDDDTSMDEQDAESTSSSKTSNTSMKSSTNIETSGSTFTPGLSSYRNNQNPLLELAHNSASTPPSSIVNDVDMNPQTDTSQHRGDPKLSITQPKERVHKRPRSPSATD